MTIVGPDGACGVASTGPSVCGVAGTDLGSSGFPTLPTPAPPSPGATPFASVSTSVGEPDPVPEEPAAGGVTRW